MYAVLPAAASVLRQWTGTRQRGFRTRPVLACSFASGAVTAKLLRDELLRFVYA